MRKSSANSEHPANPRTPQPHSLTNFETNANLNPNSDMNPHQPQTAHTPKAQTKAKIGSGPLACLHLSWLRTKASGLLTLTASIGLLASLPALMLTSGSPRLNAAETVATSVNQQDKQENPQAKTSPDKSAEKNGETASEKSKAAPARVPDWKVDNSPLPSGTPTYAPIVEKVSPSVVTINTAAKVGREGSSPLNGHPLFDDPMFRRFFGLPDTDSPREPQRGPRQAPNSKRGERSDSGRGSEGGGGSGGGNSRGKREQSAPLGLGSGVIVSADGYILTNNHVLEGADSIEVSLGSASKKYTAKKIGGDPSTDIAVLKIEAKDLPAITFADSDQLRPGDIVIAVGNPFGLTRSATMGVVSAVGRRERQMSQMADLANFIQTDAAINMGNSGGALVDYRGRLVGINTAIFSRTGANQGIGFSVPSNMARDVMENLIKFGRVPRGFLGIGLQDLTDSLEKKFNIDPGVGALVSEVQPGSPAEKAGIREYDVITGVNGKKVEGVQELRLRVASISPGSQITLQLMRDRKQTEVVAKLGEKPDRKPEVIAQETDPDVLDGVTVADLDENSRKEFNVPEKVKGALVTQVEPDSVAASAGIRPGDVIQEVERRSITSADQAVKLSEELKREKQVLLRVFSRGGSRFVMLESKP